MRRITRTLIIAAATCSPLAGCGSTGSFTQWRGPTRLARTGPASPPVEIPLFAKDGVPDAVMLGPHADPGFHGSPAPQ